MTLGEFRRLTEGLNDEICLYSPDNEGFFIKLDSLQKVKLAFEETLVDTEEEAFGIYDHFPEEKVKAEIKLAVILNF